MRLMNMLAIPSTAKLRLWLLGIAGVALVLLSSAAPAALADTATIGLSFCTGACLPQSGGSWGTVALNLNSSGGIDVSINLNPGYGLFGSGFGFNVVGSTTGLQVSNLTSGFSFNSSGGQMGTFGQFQYIIQGPSLAANAVSSLHFTVTRTGGFTSVTQLMALSIPGQSGTPMVFALHSAGGGSLNGLPYTQYLGTNDPPGAVPEPSTMALLGIGLLAVGGLKWRSFR